MARGIDAQRDPQNRSSRDAARSYVRPLICAPVPTHQEAAVARNGATSVRLLAIPLVAGLLTSGCAGWGGGGGGGDSLNVLMVNNPQMVDLQKLTEHFTKETGIRVNFTVLPENDVRDKISQEFSSQAGQYDVATLSNFEIPIYARSGWIAPLDDYVAADPEFEQPDILRPMTLSLTADDGKLYGEPFYGE